ncbi:Chloroplastic group IIB intron splicing facilitator CRS2-B, chloroplastic [Dionaea muscipula]
MLLGALSAPSPPHQRAILNFRPRRLVPAERARVSAVSPAAVAGRSAVDGREVVEYTPWLIVGLGNPGSKYHGTRHNVGFEMIDQISKKERIVLNTIQSKALIGIGSIGEVPILLAKPQAYMSCSGESVGPLAAYYGVPLRHILLVYDEMSLLNGVLRLQPKGGHGHHNGIKSVIGHLDNRREFPRLCIGIGNPPGTMDMKAFLLQKFSSTERKQIDAAVEQGAEAVRHLVLNGFNDQITRFNLGQKYKYHTV